jgi:hypothetical protein
VAAGGGAAGGAKAVSIAWILAMDVSRLTKDYIGGSAPTLRAQVVRYGDTQTTDAVSMIEPVPE